MNKNTMVIVAITALVVLMIAPRLRALPLLDKVPTV
jgi:hypothetical protein